MPSCPMCRGPILYEEVAECFGDEEFGLLVSTEYE